MYRPSTQGAFEKKLYVYLPKDYHITAKAYPVVYLLHGANGNERSWLDNGMILHYIDSLTNTNEAKEAIYVFPNMNRYYRLYDYVTSRPKGSIESYMDLNGSAEFSFINDIVTYIERTFRTIPSREYRAIAGLSLGGLQTLYITAANADRFGYIGLFSPLIYPPPSTGEFTHIYRDLEEKLEQLSSATPLLYMILIGENDFYYRPALGYSRKLENLQFNHVFIKTSGGHTWSNWKNYCIEFIKSLWKESP